MSKDKSKGLFLVSFLNLSTEPRIAIDELKGLGKIIEKVIKDTEYDVIVVDRPVVPIGKEEYKRYLQSLLDVKT